MSIHTSEIGFYVDTMMMEILVEDPVLSKRAAAGSTIMSLISKVKDYFASKINPDDKTGSIINLIAPGAISVMLSGLGMPWIGLLFGLAVNVFHIDVASILRTVYENIKSVISSGKQMSSPQIQSTVNDAIQANYTPLSPAQQEEAAKKLSHSTTETLRDARVIKLALIEYSLKKEAIPGAALVAGLAPKLISILGKVISWIFSIALHSAGLMVAGDAVNSMLGRTTGLSGSQTPEISGTTGVIPASQVTTSLPASTSRQTKFKLNPSYNATSQFSGPERIQRYVNTPEGISNMLVEFAHDVYNGLDGLDSIIRSTPGFRAIVDMIVWHNHAASGDPVIFIPDVFRSKKQMVDKFIDDVAAKAP